jgi:membrane fusion protein, heavy metal efflux system
VTDCLFQRVRGAKEAMSKSIYLGKRAGLVILAVVAILIAKGLLAPRPSHGQTTSGNTSAQPTASPQPSEVAVDLTATQLSAIKVAPLGTYLFPTDEEAVGNIGFDGDTSVQVFPQYQGTIIAMLVDLNAPVRKDQPLYTITSPDLIQAESTLIGAAAQYELTSKELARAKELNGTSGVSVRELEQATSDDLTAEGTLKAARDAVRVFGKTDAEIDQMIATRKIDPALVVRSPINGKITAKSAQPGFLVQPGNLPAPYCVSDVSTKWMLANVTESDIPLFQLGQPEDVSVMAYPDHHFRGKVSKIYETVDPNTHRATIRSEISDPNDELRPGMLANFVIQVRGPVKSLAIPANGVVRAPDGTMTAWVTTDRKHFVQRTIKIGLRQDGWVQVLDGLKRGELVVTDGAVFISNMLTAAPED